MIDRFWALAFISSSSSSSYYYLELFYFWVYLDSLDSSVFTFLFNVIVIKYLDAVIFINALVESGLVFVLISMNRAA